MKRSKIKTWFRNFFRRFGAFIVVVAAAIVSLSFIAHIPAVQKFGVQHITGILSNITGTRVEVEKFHFNFFNSLALKDVYIEAPQAVGDTLLFCESAEVKFSNLITLVNNRLTVRDIQVEGVTLDFARPDSNEVSTITALMRQLSSGRTDTEKKERGSSLEVEVGALNANNLHVIYDDDHKNTVHQYHLRQASVLFERIVPDSPLIVLEKALIDGLQISINQWAAPDVEIPKDSSESVKPLRLEVRDFVITGSQFDLVNKSKRDTVFLSGMNYADLDIRDIEIAVTDFTMEQLNFTGQLRDLSCTEKSGFELTSLKVDQAAVTDSGILLDGINLRTPRTVLTDTLRLLYSEYRDFEDFVNKVNLYGDLRQSEIAVRDLLMIVPTLANSAFFTFNADKKISITGLVTGNINRLRARRIRGNIGQLNFRGDFRSNNLTIPNEQFMNLRLERATVSIDGLRKIVPNLRLTDQYDNLGMLDFSGRFDGFFNDFVAYGEVRTDLGSASLDMRLNVTDGITAAEYSGGIALDSFNLGTWTNNADFGRITGSVQVVQGIGLTAESARAQIRGGIQSLGFRRYVYENVVINGLLDENYFSGDLEIVDDNIDLLFNGTVDLRGDDPQFDFLANVDSIDLRALNIIEDSIRFAGNFEVAGAVIAGGIDGYARAADVRVRRGATQEYFLDTIGILSEPEDSINHYRIESDYIDGRIDGEFSIVSIYPTLADYISTHYPKMFGDLKYKKDTSASTLKFDYNVNLNQPGEWSGIFGIQDLEFETLNINGGVDLNGEDVHINVSTPYLHTGAWKFFNLEAGLGVGEGLYSVQVRNDSMYFNDIGILGVGLQASGNDSISKWDLVAQSLFDSLAFDLSGRFAYDSTGTYEVTINENRSQLFDSGWDLSLGNRVAWGKDFIEIDSFVLSKNQRRIEILDVARRGLKIDIDSFDAHYIDAVWDYEKLDFYGSYSFDLYTEDIFERSRVALDLGMQDLIINGDSYGQLDLTASIEGPQEPLKASALIGTIESPLVTLEGWYDPFIKTDEQNLHAELKMYQFPATFLEYFISAISETTGTATGLITFTGDTSGVTMNGSALVRRGSTKVDVTGVRYAVRDFNVRIRDDYIDLSEAVITDRDGNTADVEGGLSHNMFKDLTLDIQVTSPKIWGINLAKSDDAVFYGTGIGSAEVFFTGRTNNPSMVVNATTAAGTRIFMPLEEGSSTSSESFLRFVQRDSLGNVLDEPEQEVLSGLDLAVNLNVTPDAQVDMIFNEDTREILRGAGEGSLQILLNRAGDLSLYGGVEVLSGNYLFTSVVVVNKPFILRPGGTIRWSGDPYNAQIRISADYEGLRTSVATLLEEYLINASPNAQQEARQLTEVQLELILTGSLLQPTINFNIRFPDLTGELAGYVDSKMKTLQADPNGLNQQVFGLLLAGTFLPSNAVAGSNQFASTAAVNTMSEFISSQLSFFVSDFLTGAVEDVDFISGIDFDVGYNESVDYIDQSQNYREWEVHMRNRLFNDRFIVDVGGSYVVDNPIATEAAYFAGDYALEYILTQDRRLKVRFYHRNEETIEGRKNKTGIGLSYRREFDNFGDWLRGLDNEAKKVRKAATRDGEQKDPN